MKTYLKNRFFLSALIAGVALTQARQVTAQTSIPVNSDGINPNAGVIVSGNTVYGTTATAGNSGRGTVFAVNTDGSGFTILHSFTANPFGTNSDGAYPIPGLILSSNTLYGTARFGGSSGNGTVFSVQLPPLPPVAQCKHVTVSVGANCLADASI